MKKHLLKSMKPSLIRKVFMMGCCLAFLTAPSTSDALKIGIIMNDHSGPEYYPSRPDGLQCAACGADEGQPYTDGQDHSADGYFAMKYFLAHLTNMSGHIPGFVPNAFERHGFGIMLMDNETGYMITDDTDYIGVGNDYTPVLIDAWGEKGITTTAFGYITYTDLLIIFTLNHQKS